MLFLLGINVALLQILAVHRAFSHPLAADAEGKIIGGVVTNITEAPFAAVLLCNDFFHCGSVIFNEKHLLTAAHCVRGPMKCNFTVRVGSSYYWKGGHLHQTKKVTPHPKYIPYHLDFDTAVVELETPISFNQFAKPIQLIAKEPEAGKAATVFGWGHTHLGSPSSIIRRLDTSIISKSECVRIYQNFITDRMICSFTPKKGPFLGDSGGPIVVDGHLAGSVSFGSSDPLNNPCVYSNYADPSIVEFIKKETSKK